MIVVANVNNSLHPRGRRICVTWTYTQGVEWTNCGEIFVYLDFNHHNVGGPILHCGNVYRSHVPHIVEIGYVRSNGIVEIVGLDLLTVIGLRHVARYRSTACTPIIR